MNRILLLFTLLFTYSLSFGQIYEIDAYNGQTINTCKGTFTSSTSTTFIGDNNGYANNEDYTVTFCSNSGSVIRANFYFIDLETNYDKLEIFDGATATGIPIATLTGSALYPGVYTSTGTCLTFRFRSDGLFRWGGWKAFLGCPPPACGINTVASDVCSSAPTICNLNGYCGSTSGWYTRDNGNIEGTPWGGSNVFSCGSIQNNSWVAFVASATSASFTITSSNCSNAANGIQAMVLSSSNCSSFTGKSSCISNGVGTFTLNATALTIGTTYYIMIDGVDGNDCDYTIQAQSGVQTINISSSQGNTLCPGESFNLSASATGTGPFAYNWSPAPASGQGTSTATYTASTSGNYQVTITGACGSSQTATYSVTVNPPPTLTTSGNTSICSGGSGTTITATATPGSSTLTFTNNTTATIPDNNTTGATSNIVVSGLPTTIGTLLSSVCLNISHGWDADVDISLRCPSGSTIDLSSDNGGSGDNYTNTCFSTSGTAITSGSPPFTGTYTPEQAFSLLSACTANGTWSLIVKDDAAPDVGTLNNWSMTIQNGVTYAWSPAAGLSSTTIANPTANPASTTTYTVVATDYAGCSSSATVIVTVNTSPAAPTVTTPVNYCVNQAASSLSATGSNLLWYTVATGGIGSATAPTPSTTTAGTTNYWVSQTLSGCESARAQITVNVNAKPTATITGTQVICASGSTTLSATGSTAGSGSISGYQWQLNGTNIGGATSSTYTTSTAGTYTVVVTNSNGCSTTSAGRIVTVNANPTASITPASATICAGTTIALNGNPAGGTTPYTHSWTGNTSPLSATNIVNPNFSTTTGGSYSLTYTVTDNNGCTGTANRTINVTALDNASFSYSSGTFCQTSANPTPTITGLAGGTFTAPGAVSISSSTGTINLAGSTPGGPYTITYTTNGACQNSSSVSITITTGFNSFFTYTDPFCKGTTNPSPSYPTGGSAGTFTVDPLTPGLNFVSSSTGQINLTTTPAGTYTVINTIAGAGGCASSSSQQSVTINAQDNAGFTYSAASFCKNGANPSPTITGAAGGTFSSTPAGLSVNGTSGVINVGASTAGTYNVTYTTNGTCPNSSIVSVTIVNADNANFSYSAASYCTNSINPTPTITGLAGGTFSAPAGLSINSTTGVINLSASTGQILPYTVTYTTAGTCPNTAQFSVTITTADDAGFTYTSNSFCTNGLNATPTITGLTGGTFTAPAGLVINSGTGVINVASSTVGGPYIVTYTTNGTCPNSSTYSISIIVADDPAFSYATNSYCTNVSDPSPTIIGLSGGTFTSTAGLTLNSATGVITLSSSTPGPYTVTYQTNGACPSNANFSLTIVEEDDASFSYSANSYCQNATTPTPTITGLAGGTFSASAGLLVNAGTGEIDLGSSTVGGPYTVSYTTSGTCPNTEIFSVSITVSDDASFTYALSDYCQNASDPTPSITGLAGGTFTAPAAVIINSGTGEIDLSASTAGGPYNITYTTNGACPNFSIFTIVINSPDNASFSYASASYCQNGSSNPTPTITGLAGGTFSAPAGLSINASTGEINLAASTPGATYTVTYTTNGTCPNNSTFDVTITNPDNAGFSYSSATYCQNGSDPTPTITGLAGGTFTAAAGLSINSTTGIIDLSASTASVTPYTITYTTNGSCVNSSTFDVTINSTDDAGFSYSSGSYCISGALTPTPTITGLAGGTFSSTVGLTLNASTGEITVATSSLGSYVITYTTNGTCPNSSTFAVDIVENPVKPDFEYPATSYCKGDPNPSPTYSTFGSPGTFTSTTGVVFVNTSTGEINLAATPAGSHQVTNTIGAQAGCAPADYTFSLDIFDQPNAIFTGLNASYCASSSAVTLTPNVVGGTFSGSGISGSTFDPAIAGVGTHIIKYVISNVNCVDSTTQTVEVLQVPIATYTGFNSPYCQSASTVTLTPTTSGGTFTGPGITGSTFSPNTAGAGSHVIKYIIIAANGCSDSTLQTVIVNALPDASFTGLDPEYCTSVVSVTLTPATAGGTFYGLGITGSTFSPSTVGPGIYGVKYIITDANSCADSTEKLVEVFASPNATFTGLAAQYCSDQSAVTLTPTTTGGTFSGNGVSGNTFDPAVAGAGTHAIKYVITTSDGCADSTTQMVDVTPIPVGTFNYPAPAYCSTSSADPSPGYTGGGVAGTFSANPAGLILNSATGQITIAGSAPGTYTVYNFLTGSNGCSDVLDSTEVTITQLPVASFNFAPQYCANATNPFPTFVGTGVAGVFSFDEIPLPLGNSLAFVSSTTGEINLAASNGGTYQITNTIAAAGGCPQVIDRDTVVINEAPVGDFQYIDTDGDSAWCVGTTNPIPTKFGLHVTDNFTSSPGLVFVNSGSGEVNLAASTPGDYIVVNTTMAVGACPSVSFDSPLAIVALDNSNFDYSAIEFCQSLVSQTPTVSLAGGSFTSTPAGLLFLNNSTGEIDLENSAPGIYSIQHTTSGYCPTSTSKTIEIKVSPVFTTSAENNGPLCEGATLQLTAGAVAGVTFSWSGPNAFSSTDENPTKNNVIPADSGIYTVTATNTGNGCPNVYPQTTTVIVKPAPVIPSGSVTDNGPLCEGDTLKLSSGFVNDVTYSWTGPSGFTSNSKDTIIINVTPSVNAGTYFVTITDTNTNCSSLTLESTTVVINPAPDFTGKVSSNGGSFCEGDDLSLYINPSIPNVIYNWSGPSAFTSSQEDPTILNVTMADSGWYRVTATDTLTGCSSTSNTMDSVLVIIYPAPLFAGISVNVGPLCEGDTLTLTASTLSNVTYSWEGPDSFTSFNQNPVINNVTTINAGIYTVIAFDNTSGCTSIKSDSTVVSINAAPNLSTSTVNNGPLCEGDTLKLNTDTLNNVTYSWTGPGTFNSNEQNPVILSIDTTNAGTYTVTGINAVTGCASTLSTQGSTIVDIIRAPVIASTIGANTPVCEGDTIKLTAGTLNVTYNWTGPNGFLSSDEDVVIPNVTVADSGLFVLEVTDNITGCKNIISADTLVQVNRAPNLSGAGMVNNNGPLCEGDTLYLTADTLANVTYTWSGPVFSSSDQNPVLLSIDTANAGIYTVTGTNTITGCVSTLSTQASTTVDINSAPVIPGGVNSNSPICEGQQLTIDAGTLTDVNYNWTGPPPFISSSEDIIITSATTANSGNYNLIVTNNNTGCSNLVTYSVTVTVNATPVIDATTPTITNADCGQTNGSITGISVTGTSVTYNWTDANNNSIGSNIDLQNIGGGTYTLTATEANGCAVSSTVFTITEAPGFIGTMSAVADSGGAPFQTAFNVVAPIGLTYTWDFGNGSTSLQTNPNAIYKEDGEFVVILTLTNAQGCSIELNDTITIKTLSSIVLVPNVFSPNGDGVNDVFNVNAKGLKTAHGLVFNRWGEKLYEWDGINEGWDGRTLSGQDCAPGTYFYMIDVTGVDGKTYPSYQGHVQLVR